MSTVITTKRVTPEYLRSGRINTSGAGITRSAAAGIISGGGDFVTIPIYSGFTGCTNTRLGIIEHFNTCIVPQAYVNCVSFSTYTGNTENDIDNRVTCLDFGHWETCTLAGNYYNKTQINAYTASTAQYSCHGCLSDLQGGLGSQMYHLSTTSYNCVQALPAFITATNTALDNRINCIDFIHFSGQTLPYYYYNKTEINAYTASTSSYSDHNCLQNLQGGLTNQRYHLAYTPYTQVLSLSNYTASTATEINTKLNTLDFVHFSGQTLPFNYYNKTQINSYTASTANNFGCHGCLADLQGGLGSQMYHLSTTSYNCVLALPQFITDTNAALSTLDTCKLDGAIYLHDKTCFQVSCLGIGVAPNRPLYISGNTAGCAVGIICQINSVNGYGLAIKSATATNYTLSILGTTSGNAVNLYGNGNICGCGCSIFADYVATSDCRLKTDIIPISNALSIIEQLQGVCYHFCNDPNCENRIGLIAQDVQKILPEIVSHSQPDENDMKYGITDDKLGLKYDKLVSVLVEAIKEQQKQINELKNNYDILNNLL